MLRGIFGSGGGAAIGGGGTSSPSTIPRWTGPSTLGDSGLIDDGTQVYTTTRRFGVGTATPSSPGTIQGAFSAAVPQLIVRDSAGASGAVWVTSNHSTLTGTIRVGPVSGGYGFAVYDSFSHTFRESGNHAMTILNGGFVGIGTASPGALLDVNTGTAAGSYVTSTRLSQTGTAANSGQRILFHNSAQAWDQGAIGSLREGANNNFALTFFTSSAGTNTERARIDSTGNVNVGGTAAGRDPVATRSLSLTGGTSLAASLDLYGPTGSSGRNWYIYTGGTPNNGLQFFDGTAGAERWRIDSSGNLILNTGNTGATIQAAGTSQGLKLPATPGNADAQTLDCYQENPLATTAGNGWTPTLSAAATWGGTLPTVDYARYIRIGSMVFCEVRLSGAALTATYGSTTISQPPVTINATAGESAVPVSTAAGSGVGVCTSTSVFLPTLGATSAMRLSWFYFTTS